MLEDPIILEAMGLQEAPLEEITQRIMQRNEWDDLTGNAMRINIYYRPSRPTRNEIVENVVLQVDVHAPVQKEHLAYRIMGRVKRLLHKYRVNGRTYYFDGMLGDLATMPGFVCVGSRFNYYATI